MKKPDIKPTPFALTVERMLSMHPKMNDAEKQALADWEKINLGSKGTTDWPGWESVYARLSH